jgi:RNA polymerase sigma-70 factor (ECF subfamily)
LDYEHVVALHHENLYRFAFSLAGNADDAAELTQETYVRLLTKGSQLRDHARVKTWLFTTLYRIFAGWKRHAHRFPHLEICSVEGELPAITPELADEMDGDSIMETALELDEHFRVPLVLYYLQSLTYREIAQVLELPIGTVMSRLSRGKDLLRQRLATRKTREHAVASNVISPQQFIRAEGQ